MIDVTCLQQDTLVAVVRYFVNQLADEFGWSTEDIQQRMRLKHLFNYMQEPRNRSERLYAAMARELHVSADVVRTIIEELLGEPFVFCQTLLPLWILISQPQPPIKHRPCQIVTELALLWPDDRVTKFLAVNNVNASQRVSNGMVATAVQQMVSSLVQGLLKEGVDGFYAHSLPVGDEPRENPDDGDGTSDAPLD